MTTKRANARRLEEGNVEQAVPPHVLIDLLNENVTNVEFRSVFQELAQAVMEQDNSLVVVPANPCLGTAAARVRDFTKINPPEFYGSKVEEHP